MRNKKAGLASTFLMGADIRSIARDETRTGDAGADSVASCAEQLVLAGDELSERFKGVEDGSGLASQMLEWQESITSKDQLPRYAFNELLGLGAQGFVFSVSDSDCGRKVALKTMRGSDKSAAHIARFVHEAQVTAQLEHPGVVPVYELNVLPDGTLFYTMKKIGGRSLADELRFKKSDANRRFHFLQIFLKICDTMSFAHSRGVVHRDLKPANIMIGDYGEVMVLDWGLSKVLGQAEVVSLRSQNAQDESGSEVYVTRDGQTVGTPAYMSPEQANGHRDSLDARSDVYALGVILYEMLSQHLPYTGLDVESILEQVGRGVWTPLNRQLHARNENPQLIAIVHKAMAVNPDDRYLSVDALARDLRSNIADQAVSVYADTVPDRVLRYVRRNKAQLKTASYIILIFFIIGSAAFATVNYMDEQKVYALKLSAFHKVTHGRLSEAVEDFDDILRRDDNNIFAYAGLSETQERIEDNERRQKLDDEEKRQQDKQEERKQFFVAAMNSMKQNIEREDWSGAFASYTVAFSYSPAGENIETPELRALREQLEKDKDASDALREYIRKMKRSEYFEQLAQQAETEKLFAVAGTNIREAIRSLPEKDEQRRAQLTLIAKRLSDKAVDSRLQRELNMQKKIHEKELRDSQQRAVKLAEKKLATVKQLMIRYSETNAQLIAIRISKESVEHKLRNDDNASMQELLLVEDRIRGLQEQQVSWKVKIEELLSQAQELVPDLLAVKEAWALHYIGEIHIADARSDHIAAQVAAARGLDLQVDNAAYQRIFTGLVAVHNQSRSTPLDIFTTRYTTDGVLSIHEKLLSIAPGEIKDVHIGRYFFRFSEKNHCSQILRRGQDVQFSDAGIERFQRMQQRITKNTDVRKNPVFDLAYVPAGAVIIDGQDHAVAGFAMSRYEVSFGDYIQFLNRSRPLRERALDEPRLSSNDRLLKHDSKGKFHLQYVRGRSLPLASRTPVYGITYTMIERYIEWLNKRTGLAWRLPTQAEWQLAAQGADARSYPWGDKPDYKKRLCYSANTHDSRYSQVYKIAGSFPLDCTVNGIYDLAGSLSEIVHSSGRVHDLVTICGGSYADNKDERFRGTSIRKISGKNAIDNRVGFRLVISLDQKGSLGDE